MKINRIGNTPFIDEEKALKGAYKSLPLTDRLTKNINIPYMKQKSKLQVIYHPFWIAKTLVIADRPPFPPRKSPNMIFVDGVSGYRGVFSKIPAMSEMEVNRDAVQSFMITQKEEAKKYITDVQMKQINRMYLLKKPRHEIIAISVGYVPIWKVEINTPIIHDVFYINANTGESENHMAQRWKDRGDLIS